MKRNILSVIIFLCILPSCEEFQPVFTLNYDDPEKIDYDAVSMDVTHSIAELAAMYTAGNPWTIDQDIVISGKVSTTDRYGNFYKSLYIQDDTGGMEIKIGKNGLYNDYHPGQTLYISCRDLELGMYGYSSSSGNGMVQLGFNDPSGDYETSYMEASLLIDTHVFKGSLGDEVEPIEISFSELPDSWDTQATNPYIGKLVTIKDLYYTWYDSSYGGTLYEVFVLLYLDSNKDKTLSSNRIFISGSETGVTTWAMSEEKMSEYLESGIWDEYPIGNSGSYTRYTVGDYKGNINSLTGKPYDGIERAAYSVSQYFSTEKGTGGTCVQVRTSGYSRFADTEIDPLVLSGDISINVTGILSLYQGRIQITVNNITDIEYNYNE